MKTIHLYLVNSRSPINEITLALKQASEELSSKPSILFTRLWDQRDPNEQNLYHWVMAHEIHDDGDSIVGFRKLLESLGRENKLEISHHQGIARFRPLPENT